MTALQLYKFINKESSVEWRWDSNNGKQDVIIWIRFYDIEDFVKLLSPSHFDEGSMQVWLRDDTIALFMNGICEACGIEIEEVFPKSN